MASASVAARGIRGAALINGKILDDAIIGIDPTGVGKIVSVARARNGTALAARARRVTGLIIPGYVDIHLHGAGGHDVLGPGGAHELLMSSRGVRNQSVTLLPRCVHLLQRRQSTATQRSSQHR